MVWYIARLTGPCVILFPAEILVPWQGVVYYLVQQSSSDEVSSRVVSLGKYKERVISLTNQRLGALNARVSISSVCWVPG